MSISFIQQLNDSTVFCLKNNEHIIHNIKKKKFSDTFRRNSVLDSKTTVNIKNILKLINSSYNEDTYKKNIEHIINDPLFDKNNGKFLNKIWEKNSDYFLERDQSIFNSEVKKAFAKNNDKLIKIFLDNGLNYIDKFILCVDPSSYSHSAIILKFNKPIKFDDSNADVAGVLYTLSMDSKHNNSKKTILTKIFRFFRQLLSFIFTWKFHMAKILLTSDDLNYIELENRDKSLEKFSIDGKNIECTLESSFNILDTLEKAKNLNLVNYTVSEYNNLLKSLTSNIQKISYFFNIYNINISKDKIINYSFDNNNNLNLDISSNKNGYSIYDFLWEDCEKLNLTHERKLHVIKKFLEVESLKLLKENNIIDKNATEFNFSDFYKLPKKIPSDLREKFRYTKITTFDLNKEPLSSLNVSSLEVSKRGYRLMSKLEKFNTKQEFYCFFQNNCITTLKRTISKCSKEHKELIKNANKNLNIIEKRHPLSVFNELKKLNKDKYFILREVVLMDTVLQANNIVKRYGKKTVLNNISITINKGDIYGLIGPNGAGKTTFMRTVLNLAKQNSGTISFFGNQNIQQAGIKIGSLIEEPGLLRKSTAYENLKRFSILYGSDCAKIDELLKLVGLDALRDKKVKTFSLGMKQRLGIAIALLGNPEFLVLDEPINGLDPIGIRNIRELFVKLNKEKNITLFISSHHLDELSKIATKYGVINNGVLVDEIDTLVLQERYNDIEDYFIEKIGGQS